MVYFQVSFRPNRRRIEPEGRRLARRTEPAQGDGLHFAFASFYHIAHPLTFTAALIQLHVPAPHIYRLFCPDSARSEPDGQRALRGRPYSAFLDRANEGMAAAGATMMPVFHRECLDPRWVSPLDPS